MARAAVITENYLHSSSAYYVFMLIASRSTFAETRLRPVKERGYKIDMKVSACLKVATMLFA